MFKIFAACCVAFAVAGGTALSAQTVLDGVYSTAQSERGRVAYMTHCSACHGMTLEGVSAPALTNARFIERWREGPLNGLYAFIRQTMPFGRVASANISANQYVDIVTYILNVNQYPAGATELSQDSLRRVMLVGKSGPQPVPDGAHVIAIGCITNTNDQWLLSRATEPARTPSDVTPNPVELKDSAEKKLGTSTFRLADMEAVPDFSPAAHNGHKVQVKGFLVRQPNAERISVTSIEMLEAKCAE